jgi:hypothetical protein
MVPGYYCKSTRLHGLVLTTDGNCVKTLLASPKRHRRGNEQENVEGAITDETSPHHPYRPTVRSTEMNLNTPSSLERRPPIRLLIILHKHLPRTQAINHPFLGPRLLRLLKRLLAHRRRRPNKNHWHGLLTSMRQVQRDSQQILSQTLRISQSCHQQNERNDKEGKINASQR